MALTAELLENQYVVRGWSLEVVLVLVYGISSIFFDEIPHKSLPMVGETGWEVSKSKAKMRYMMSARQIIGQGFEKGKMIFQMIFPHGPTIVLHPEYLEEIRGNPRLSLDQAALPVGDYSGFEAFRGIDNHLILLDVGQERHEDFLYWMEDAAAGRPFDPITLQIGLTLVTIHTTSNLLTNVVYDLAAHPEYLQPLREEIKSVMAEDGILQKTSLTKMKLLDSVVKESQGLKPPGLTSIQRYATETINLRDNTTIPKGASLVVSTHVMQDSSVYPDPNFYDGCRFYNQRQEPGNENKHQLVMTSSQHFGFGHGLHACPGRFFAANEITILLVHLVMKYDLKFADGQTRPPNMEFGIDLVCDQTAQVLFKAREPEINLACFGQV